MDITSLMVRSEDGLIDVSATLAKVRETLEMKNIFEAELTSNIVNQINIIYDNHPVGHRIPMSILTATVASALGTPPKEFTKQCDDIEQFVRSSPERFDIGRGRSGGVMRIK
jgi:hypothetical protein